MGAVFPTEVTVLIGAADAVSSDCTEYTTLMTNFSQSGGERDVESIPLFGNANIDKENPRSQIEVSFEGIVQYDSSPLLFDAFLMGSDLTATTLESSQDPVGKVVYMEFTDGSVTLTRAYNNVLGVSFEPEMSADEYLKGTLTMKLSPTDAAGASNMKITKAAASTISW